MGTSTGTVGNINPGASSLGRNILGSERTPEQIERIFSGATTSTSLQLNSSRETFNELAPHIAALQQATHLLQNGIPATLNVDGTWSPDTYTPVGPWVAIMINRPVGDAALILPKNGMSFLKREDAELQALLYVANGRGGMDQTNLPDATLLRSINIASVVLHASTNALQLLADLPLSRPRPTKTTEETHTTQAA